MKCCTDNLPKLNKLVTVQRLKSNLTPNGGGHIDETDDSKWTDAGREWVEFITKGSREFFRGQEIAADITHQVTMRWSKQASGYTTDMRLKLDGRKFNISEPPRNVNEQNQWIVMAVKEIK